MNKIPKKQYIPWKQRRFEENYSVLSEEEFLRNRALYLHPRFTDRGILGELSRDLCEIYHGGKNPRGRETIKNCLVRLGVLKGRLVRENIVFSEKFLKRYLNGSL